MDWGQIEVKWAEMARRVRSDLPCPAPDGSAFDTPASPPDDLPDPSEPAPETAKAIAG